MRKQTAVLISVVLIAGFAGIVYYGVRHSRGIPTKVEKIERPVLGAPFLDTEIDLGKGISQSTWEGLPAVEIKLMYQVMVFPWPKAVTPSVSVKAFHNKKDIYFYLSWQDDTEDKIFEMDRFSDASAVLFPLGKEIQPVSLMMGFLGKANIWQWKASQDEEFWQGKTSQTTAYADYYYPFEEKETFPVSKPALKSSANDLIAKRVGTVTPKENQNVEARGFYGGGTWQVVFRRNLDAVEPDEDAVFDSKEKRLCAFAVWNGAKGDRGGRKSISDWVELVIR